jgi:hypothetical protein
MEIPTPSRTCIDGPTHAQRIGNSSPPIGTGVDPGTLLRLPREIPRLEVIVDGSTMRLLVEVIRSSRLSCRGAGTQGTTTPVLGRAPTPALDYPGTTAQVPPRPTRSRIRVGREAHESRLAPDAEIEARIEMKWTQAGVSLRGLVRTRERKRGEITTEDQQERRLPEADLRYENEVRQASEDLLGEARLAVNEAGNEAKADLLVEPGLIADQGSLVGPGLQVETSFHPNVGTTTDRPRDAE